VVWTVTSAASHAFRVSPSFELPQTHAIGLRRINGRGRASMWSIRCDLDHAPKGVSALHITLAGAGGMGGLAVNGTDV
jgi:hypothetical protein